MSSLDQELAALAAMSSAQLREEWQRVMRTAPPAFSPDLLERAIAYELQARRHGGLAPAVQRALDRVGRQLTRTGKVSPPITGTAWSGPRFFGLKAREAAGGQA
jgi:hypothetical protein